MRIEDWPSRLQSLLDQARTQEFTWGTWDCCQWSGLAVEAQTGTNPVGHIRGRYRTAIGAQRVLKRHFGGSLRAGVTLAMGEPVPPLMAGRGDLALVRIDDTEAVGVVDLSGERVVCIGLDGPEYVPLSAAVAAWKV